MNSALILAGGRGKRMESDISKQFIDIKGKPVLYYTIKRFMNNNNIDEIVVVLPKDEIDYCMKNVIDKYNLKVDHIVEGGKERQDSVYNGLKILNNTGVVLIHDGARPFVSDEVIQKGIEFAIEYGAAAPGVMPKDTVKVIDESSFSKETLERDKLVCIQTPQVFKLNIIKECHERVNKDKIAVTDDTMVVELYNNKVYIYEGDYKNIKITTPEDIMIAESMMR